MPDFRIVSEHKPQGDQPRAIGELTEGILRGDRFQTLLGVTGSGKTFTMGAGPGWPALRARVAPVPQRSLIESPQGSAAQSRMAHARPRTIDVSRGRFCLLRDLETSIKRNERPQQVVLVAGEIHHGC
jgi:hypothetical protein